MLRNVLFYRDFRGLTGGHLKVFHYFQHFQSFPEFRPDIFFSPQSRWSPDNPWVAAEPRLVSEWRPEKYDVLFLAGMDWSILSREAASRPIRPVINLIQGLRHSDPGSPLRSYLSYPAVRICVSQQVADAIVGTGEVNGPVHVVPNGIEHVENQDPRAMQNSLDILIVGKKNPLLANRLYEKLRHLYACRNVATFLPRGELIALMQKSTVTICLPDQREGFYLPALEAMAAGSLVICPDCVGNRDFCHDGWNMLKPSFDISHLETAAHTAVAMHDTVRAVVLKNARQTAGQHSLAAEGRKLQTILGCYQDFFAKDGAIAPGEKRC